MGHQGGAQVRFEPRNEVSRRNRQWLISKVLHIFSVEWADCTLIQTHRGNKTCIALYCILYLITTLAPTTRHDRNRNRNGQSIRTGASLRPRAVQADDNLAAITVNDWLWLVQAAHVLSEIL